MPISAIADWEASMVSLSRNFNTTIIASTVYCGSVPVANGF